MYSREPRRSAPSPMSLPNFVASTTWSRRPCERVADDRLAGAGAVDVGGVEERDAGLDRRVDDGVRSGLVDAPAEVVAAQADHADFQRPEGAGAHCGTVPIGSEAMRYWEDFAVGDVTELGEIAVTAEEIIAFAEQYDPQPFHIDPAAAEDGPFGGLIASGWHTAALFMSLFVRGILLDSASMGSPGIEQLRWTAPVRPGDRLHARVTVTDSQPSSTNPKRGTIFTTSEVFNQDDVLVMTMQARGFFARRPTST